MDVPHTILSHLGGNRFIAMTGAKNFLSGDASLSFRIPSAANKIVGVKVKLEQTDTYSVEFFKKAPRDPVFRTSFGVTVASTRTNVYADNLRDVFTAETGLMTSL